MCGQYWVGRVQILPKPRLSWAIPGSCREFLVAWEALPLKTPQYSQLFLAPRRWR